VHECRRVCQDYDGQRTTDGRLTYFLECASESAGIRVYGACHGRGTSELRHQIKLWSSIGICDLNAPSLLSNAVNSITKTSLQASVNAGEAWKDDLMLSYDPIR
jgi:hypothetical protein